MPGIKLFRSFRFVSFRFVRVTGMATGWDRRGILDGVAIHRCSTHPSTRFRGSVLLPPVCSFGAGEIPLHPAPDPVDPSSGRGSRRPTVVHTCPRADHAVCVCVGGGEDRAPIGGGGGFHEAGWLNPCAAHADF
jgi:hypothetical protein